MPSQPDIRMLVKQFLLVVSVLILLKAPVCGQSVPSLADTSAILAQLREAEAIEMQEPEKALREYRYALAASQKTGFTKGYFESVRLITYLDSNWPKNNAGSSNWNRRSNARSCGCWWG